MENDHSETLIFYILENCFYFMDQEESSCEQCSANGYPGAECPFHMDKMSYHCPCRVSIELEEKMLVVESEIAEV
jgi:sulfatase maturation enzyme AslB (radical SAM superfamily)